ncbi:MAG: rod shape-determining protein MreD, partial [Clostridiales bacterium]|nr:rod shape-determining protein MreD [Clostridiales bacterium]
LEFLVLPRLPLFGAAPLLLPLAAVTAGLLEGSRAGAGFGLLVGLLCDVSYYGSSAVVFAMTLLGVCAGLAAKRGLRQNLGGCMLCCAGALVLLAGVQVLYRLATGVAPLGVLLRVAGPEVLWSLLCAPLVYGLFRLAYRRVGGLTLM